MNEMISGVGGVMEKMRASLAMKVIVLGFILLGLLIPLMMTTSLREERQGRASMAAEEVSSHWGGQTYLNCMSGLPWPLASSRDLRR